MTHFGANPILLAPRTLLPFIRYAGGEFWPSFDTYKLFGGKYRVFLLIEILFFQLNSYSNNNLFFFKI
jgi:hypothetical protein